MKFHPNHSNKMYMAEKQNSWESTNPQCRAGKPDPTICVLGEERKRNKRKRTGQNKERKEKRTSEMFSGPDTCSPPRIRNEFNSLNNCVRCGLLPHLRCRGHKVAKMGIASQHWPTPNPMPLMPLFCCYPVYSQPQFSFWIYSIFESKVRNKAKIFRGLKREKCLLLSFHFMFIVLHF